MAEKHKLNSTPRTLFGRKVKRLRRQGLIPANIFGKKVKSRAVQVDLKDFAKLFQAAGETSLIDLTFDKQTKPVLIKNVQLDPVTNLPLHVDFHQVDLTEKVTADIPVEIIGESPAVKELGGVMEIPLSEIEVEALPGDLPEKIEIDISNLKDIGQSVSAADLKLSSKVEIITDPATVIVIISEPKEEVVEEPPAPTEEAEAPVEPQNQEVDQAPEETEKTQE